MIMFKKVYELADRLKFYDPVLEKTLDDQPPSSPQHDNGVSDFNIQEQQQQQQLEGQKWLQSLRDLANKQQVQTANIKLLLICVINFSPKN